MGYNNTRLALQPFPDHAQLRLRRCWLLLGWGLVIAIICAVHTLEVADMAAGVAGVLFGWMLAAPRLPNYLRLAERLVTALRRG